MNAPAPTPAQRAAFAALADTIVPGDATTPGAAAVGVSTTLLDQALAARPQAAVPLLALLDLAAGQAPAAFVATLERADPPAFELLLSMAAGAWLLDPGVRAALGYPGQQALALPEGGHGGEDLLGHVRPPGAGVARPSPP